MPPELSIIQNDNAMMEKTILSPELCATRNVDEDRALIGPKLLHDETPGLQDAIKKVPLASAEPTPVSQDEKRQALQCKLFHSHCCLLGRIRIPNLPCLRDL